MADRSLLLVDDDALLLDSLVRILRVRFLVRTATSPIRALEMLRAIATRIERTTAKAVATAARVWSRR